MSQEALTYAIILTNMCLLILAVISWRAVVRRTKSVVEKDNEMLVNLVDRMCEVFREVTPGPNDYMIVAACGVCGNNKISKSADGPVCGLCGAPFTIATMSLLDYHASPELLELNSVIKGDRRFS